jgi:hypothetical protein
MYPQKTTLWLHPFPPKTNYYLVIRFNGKKLKSLNFLEIPRAKC